MITMPVELYTDGSCLGNPGPGGLGYVIRYWETNEENELPEVKTIEGNQGFRLTTNNRMEILASIYGIQTILKNESMNIGKIDTAGVSQINLFTDSKYFCDAINQKWIDKWQQNHWMTYSKTPVKNKDLWEQMIAIINTLHSINVILTINHIPGHQGHEFNEKADRLAVSASNGNDYIIDEIYEKSNKR